MPLPSSPAEWLDVMVRLHLGNLKERARVATYYDGDFNHPEFDGRYMEAYNQIWREARSNWGRLIVDVAVDRLSVEGVRLDASDADEIAWRLWQTSGLDAAQSDVYVDALLFGTASVSVWPDAANEPVARPESALEVSHLTDSTRQSVAAIKLWADPAGDIRADLFLPEAIYRYVVPEMTTIKDAAALRPLWRTYDEPIPNPFAPTLPLVQFENRLRLGVVQGDLEDIIPAIDRLTRLQVDLLLISKCLGFPQRWGTGIEIPRDPQGNPIAPFRAAVDKLWLSENDAAKFGSFPQADLMGIIKAIDMTVGEIAARSRTPAYLLNMTQLANPPSVGALQVIESGLLSRVQSKQRMFGESWERVMRLMLRTIQDPRAELQTSEMIWHDPETHNESVRADALIKLKGVGVPDEMLWELWGFSPQQVDRMRDQRTDQALTAALSAALPPL